MPSIAGMLAMMAPGTAVPPDPRRLRAHRWDAPRDDLQPSPASRLARAEHHPAVPRAPRADDMELIAAELATNAIRHTASGQDGGKFTLTVRTEPGWARLEVSDAGTGEWKGPRNASDDDEYGRGLAIVAALADKLGHDIRAVGQTVWAEVE
jgi:anti-sigma regulatory factor (Ser/Thr protein kinase)